MELLHNVLLRNDSRIINFFHFRLWPNVYRWRWINVKSWLKSSVMAQSYVLCVCASVPLIVCYYLCYTFAESWCNGKTWAVVWWILLWLEIWRKSFLKNDSRYLYDKANFVLYLSVLFRKWGFDALYHLINEHFQYRLPSTVQTVYRLNW